MTELDFILSMDGASIDTRKKLCFEYFNFVMDLSYSEFKNYYPFVTDSDMEFIN